MTSPRRAISLMGLSLATFVLAPAAIINQADAQSFQSFQLDATPAAATPARGEAAARAAVAQAAAIEAAKAKASQAAETPAKQPAKPTNGAAGPKPDGAKPAAGTTKPDGDDAKSKDKTASDKSKPVERPTTPPEPPDPEELKVRPDEQGKVRFSFRGQPWHGVLQWLEEISGMSLDWQTIPAGYLNLTTRRSYTVDEVRDLINERLLARGYTMLRQGEVLAVVNIKDELNPSMVPRVAPQGLDRRDPHEFVKVSFPLRSLLAEDAVKEFEPMLSRNGSLKPLKMTNRLEAIDVVVNLLEIRELLAEEESVESQERMVKPFHLQYTAAVEVKKQLEELLGLETKKPAVAMNAQQRQQAAQLAAQRAQQNKGKKAPAAKKAPDVHLVVLPRENTILAHAPPDKMAIIAQAINVIDVPRVNVPLQGMTTGVQIYRLQTVDPESVVKVLQELGDLDYDTRLQADKPNKAIIAYASLADHVRIRQLVSRLDGSGRTMHLLPLARQLKAKDTAAAIKFMMTGEETEEEPSQAGSSSSRFNIFSSRSSSSYRRRQQIDPEAFRVQADVRTNSLRLWANSAELDKVTKFLGMLGRNAAAHQEDREVKSYRLTAIDPSALVTTLQSMDVLEYGTLLQVDVKSKSILAQASAADHKIIKELIEKLDSSGREFHVIQLRHLAADYVAGSIEFLLDAGEVKPKSTDRYDYYNWYPYTNQMKPPPKDPKDTLRVEADVENNRLIVVANNVEWQQINELLVMLGEIPPEGGKSDTVRVLDVDASKDFEALLEKIRRSWTGPNELKLDLPDKSNEEMKEEERSDPPKNKVLDTVTTTHYEPARTRDIEPLDVAAPAQAAQRRKPTAPEQPPVMLALLQQDQAAADAPAKSEPDSKSGEPAESETPATDEPSSAAAPAPISISRGADGRLVISSEDTKALDQLEKLVAQLAPRRPDYETFVLKYVDALSVSISLREFFEEKEEESGSGYNPYYGFYGRSPQNSQSSGSSRLSRRRPLRFIWEPTNNSILVQGASPSQLQTVRELIEFYDQREMDSDSARVNQIFSIKYSKASVVADTVKDVFRDLLSKNDKALQRDQKKTENVERITTYNYGGAGESEHKVPKFQGLLSIGVDELTQTLIVSAPKFVMKPVAQMIEDLDNAAKPLSTVKVVTVGPGVNSAELRETLAKLLGESRTSEPDKKGEQKPQGQPGQNGAQPGNSSNGTRATLSIGR